MSQWYLSMDEDTILKPSYTFTFVCPLVLYSQGNTHCYSLHYYSRKQAAWSQPACLPWDCGRTPLIYTHSWLSHQLMITPGCTDPMLQQLAGSLIALVLLLNTKIE